MILKTVMIIDLQFILVEFIENFKYSILSLSKDKNKRIALGGEARKRAEELFSEETIFL